MITSKTPYRVSFFGGGTDYPAWYLKEGGAVLSTTIDKYCYISCRVLPPFFVERHRVVWSHIEKVSSISEILHPAVRECLRFMGFDDSLGLEIHHQGDLPARSGIGSSSSFVVGLIKALIALRGGAIDKKELALKALELEQNVMREAVGSQDQIAAAYGGFNAVFFSHDGSFRVEPVNAAPGRLEDIESNLMLFYLGTSRLASEIARKILDNLERKQAVLKKMRGLVDRALSILSGGKNADAFGDLLHETWLLKRDMASEVSNPRVDSIYETARGNGALGGKLCGAGGTGFLLLYVPRDKQDAVKQALANCLHVPFKFESSGSALVSLG